MPPAVVILADNSTVVHAAGDQRTGLIAEIQRGIAHLGDIILYAEIQLQTDGAEDAADIGIAGDRAAVFGAGDPAVMLFFKVTGVGEVLKAVLDLILKALVPVRLPVGLFAANQVGDGAELGC